MRPHSPASCCTMDCVRQPLRCTTCSRSYSFTRHVVVVRLAGQYLPYKRTIFVCVGFQLMYVPGFGLKQASGCAAQILNSLPSPSPPPLPPCAQLHHIDTSHGALYHGWTAKASAVCIYSARWCHKWSWTRISRRRRGPVLGYVPIKRQAAMSPATSSLTQPPPPPIFTGGTADSRLITGGGLAHLVPTVMQIVLLYRSLGDHTDAQVREVRVVYRCCKCVHIHAWSPCRSTALPHNNPPIHHPSTPQINRSNLFIVFPMGILGSMASLVALFYITSTTTFKTRSLKEIQRYK